MTREKKRILLGALLVAAVLYGLDDLSARFGGPDRPRFSTFTITRFYHVNEKFNKFSIVAAPTLEERCVNALLPHSGSSPCWYVKRHTTQTIVVN